MMNRTANRKTLTCVCGEENRDCSPNAVAWRCGECVMLGREHPRAEQAGLPLEIAASE